MFLTAWHTLSQTLYDPIFIAMYNLFYTSMPVLALGVFEQDVNAENSLKFPRLYTPGLHSSQFNKMAFLRASLHGFVTAFVLFFIPFGKCPSLNAHTLTPVSLQGLTITAWTRKGVAWPIIRRSAVSWPPFWS